MNKKVALVTGGSRGIGKAIVIFLASEEADYINSEVIKIDGGY